MTNTDEGFFARTSVWTFICMAAFATAMAHGFGLGEELKGEAQASVIYPLAIFTLISTCIFAYTGAVLKQSGGGGI
ncbi:MAG: hypothetical protein AAB955_02225 [Patescibacteria group bacterium]